MPTSSPHSPAAPYAGFSAPLGAASRMLGLDSFRGLAVLLMLLLTASEDPAFPSWFLHDPTPGSDPDAPARFALADIVFPWFLFAAGAAFPLSMAQGRGRDRPAIAFFFHMLRRAILFAGLGVVLHCATAGYKSPLGLDVFRHPGFLGLVACASVAAGFLAMFPWWMRVASVVAILVLKSYALASPGSAPGDEPGDEPGITLHAALIARHGFPAVLLLQGLAASAIHLLAGFAMDALRHAPWNENKRATVVLTGGALFALAGLTMHALGWRMDHSVISPALILFSSGSGAIVLAAMTWLTDSTQLTGFTPLRVLGLNPIAMYAVSQFAWRAVFTTWLIVTPGPEPKPFFTGVREWLIHATGPTLGPWLLALAYISAYWLFARFLWRRGVFLRV